MGIKVTKRTLFLISLGLILILAVGGYYFYSLKPKKETQALEFMGVLVNLEGNTVTLQGNFVSSHIIMASRSFSFQINERTYFEKISPNLPSLEDVRKEAAKKASGSFTILPTIESGSSTDLKNLLSQRGTIYVKAYFPNFIIGPEILTASSVSYNIINSPAE